MTAASPRLRSFLRSSTLYLGLAGMFAAGHMVSPQFLTIDNQRDVLWQVSGIGIIAIGMTLVILTAGIDLSVGSMLSLCSVVCAMLLMKREWTHATTLAIPSFAVTCGLLAGGIAAACRIGGATTTPTLARRLLSWAIGLAGAGAGAVWAVRQVPTGFGVVGVLLVVPTVGLVLGGLSGTIIAKARLQPFIVTLAMMVSAVGLAKYVAGLGGAIQPVYMGGPAGEPSAPATFKRLAENIFPVAGSELIPIPGIFFVASAVLAWLLLNKLGVGRRVLAVGGNEEAGRLSGINTDRVKILVYALSGLVSALAAVLYCAQFEQGKPDAGWGKELDAIAAVVIGGTSLMGGRGTVGGTVVGVFIFGYLNNILNLGGVSSEFQQILKGVIIVTAVLLQEGIVARWIGGAYRRIKGLLAIRGIGS
ncbi:MAG TPA: ABC transporter permease [Phycisphaerae bacterium]|nr:ABC transporter permease [Phycisphaerae bacterium]